MMLCTRCIVIVCTVTVCAEAFVHGSQDARVDVCEHEVAE
jgi:hypothetical protein